MKKISMLLVLMCSLLMSGCMKNYKTVDEYYDAMETVKKKHGSYTIEGRVINDYAEMYYKTYIKGEKWKTEMSMNGGKSYISTTMYDGVDLVSYNGWSKFAIVNPVTKFMRNATPEEIKDVINAQNQLNTVYNWKDDDIYTSIIHKDDSQGKFVNKKDKRNNFDCRLIQFGDYKEICVSDKYGIAVYQKITSEYMGKTNESQINVVNIDTSEIKDSFFDLPDGMAKKDAFEALNEIPGMLNDMKENINDISKSMGSMSNY